MILENFIPADIAEEERLSFLENNADSVEETVYVRKFSDEEMKHEERMFLNNSKSIDVLENEKKAQISFYSSQIKTLKSENRKSMNNLTLEGEEVTGKLFNIIYLEEQMVGRYDANGVLISCRPMNKKEKQLYIFNAGAHLKVKKQSNG